MALAYPVSRVSPVFGLAHGAHGGPIDNSGCGEAPIEVRDYDTVAVIAGGSTSYGPWYIGNVARFSIWARITIGSLTTAVITIRYPLASSLTVGFDPAILRYTAGSRVIALNVAAGITLSYVITGVDANVILPFINPGAEYVIIGLGSSGNTAGSRGGLWISRSYLPHTLGQGIPAS